MISKLIFDHYPLQTKNLPRDWAVGSIGQIAKFVASGFPCGQHNQDRKGVPHIRPMNIDREGRLDLNLLKYVDGEIPRELEKGDVLFNNTNSSDLVGKTTAVLVDTRLAYSNHMTRIRLADGVSPVFVARQLHFLWMCGYFRHRCVNHVNQASISADPLSETVPVVLPPAAEQERIADALDELLPGIEAGVAALGRVREKLKLYRASVLKAAVEGTLTAGWRKQHPHVETASELLKRILAERRRHWEEDQLAKIKVTGQKLFENWKAKYKEPAAPDNVDLIHLPKSWALASMDTMTLRITSGSRDWQQYYGIGSGTFIMAQNVRPGRFDPSIRQPVSPPPNDPSCERSRVKESDLLVTIVGANTGDVCRVPQPLSEHYVCQSVALMRPVDRKTAKYLDYYHNAQNGGQMYYRRYIYGAGRPHLSFDQLKVTPVIIPPLDEQEAIVEAVEDHLSMIEHLEADLDAKLRTAQTLRQAILRHAFTGKLVPQDPNDEPASELLKRVATEREARTRDAAAAKRAAKMTNAAWRRRPVKQKQKEQVA